MGIDFEEIQKLNNPEVSEYTNYSEPKKKTVASSVKGLILDDINNKKKSLMKSLRGNTRNYVRGILLEILDIWLPEDKTRQGYTSYSKAGNKGKATVNSSLNNPAVKSASLSKATTTVKQGALELVEFDTINFSTKESAENCLLQMRAMIKMDSLCDVSDMFRVAGLDTDFAEKGYGWYDLTGSRVKCVGTDENGDKVFRLILPKAVDLSGGSL